MPPITSTAPNFTLDEFQRVSNVTLDAGMVNHARWHANMLQKARDAVNDVYPGGDWRIGLTSYIRSASGGDHATGAGLDWNVRDRTGKRNDSLTRWARDWLALNHPSEFAELIYEPGFSEGTAAHVHHARRGFSKDADANRNPQILDEVSEGNFVVANILPFPRQVNITLAAIIGIALLALLWRSPA